MNKKITGFISVLLVSTLLLSGCRSGGVPKASEAASQNNAAQSSTEASSPVTVTLSGWGASPEETELLQQTLDEFEKANPNIKVNYEVISDSYMDVIKTRLVGGEAPDVFYLDSSEAAGLIEKGVLEPLDSYVKDDFDLGDFEQPLLNAFKGADGHMYGFPKGYSTLALFYNKQMFKDAGISGPPTTWDEMLQDAKKLSKNGVYGLGVAPELARLMYVIQAYGGKVVDENGHAAFATPETVKALQPIIDLAKAKAAGQASDAGASWGGEMFGQQKAAMVLEGNWALPYLQSNFANLDFATAEVPAINGNKSTMAFTVAYVMNKDSKKKDAAWKLISYLTGKEGMKTWTSKGFELPSRKSVAAELGFDKDPLRGALVAGGSYSIPWQAGSTLPTILTNFNNQFLSAFLGEQPLDKALQKAQETANKEIDAAK